MVIGGEGALGGGHSAGGHSTGGTHRGLLSGGALNGEHSAGNIQRGGGLHFSGGARPQNAPPPLATGLEHMRDIEMASTLRVWWRIGGRQ